MMQALEDQTIEDWANFNFQEGEANKTTPETKPETFQTELPDGFSEEPETFVQDTQAESMLSSATQEKSPSAVNDSPPLPAYQGLEIPIAEVPIYKRPHMKAIFFGSGVLLVMMGLGAALTRGTGIELGNQASEAPEIAPDTKPEDGQQKLSELEGEVAFGTLKNRAAVLEEQKKQRILSEKLEKGKQSDQKNPAQIQRVPLPAASPVSSPPRIPLSGIPTRVVAPVIPSRSSTAPSFVDRPASRPSLPSRAIASAPVQRASVQETPTLLSFGAMPDSEELPTAQSGGFTTVSNRGTAALESKPNQLLAQQETAFLSGRRQTMIQGGQTIPAQITEQVLAANEATFIVRTTGSILGLPQGTELIAQVTQFAGDGRMTAEAIAISNLDGSQTSIPQGAVSITKSNGDLLRATSKKGFFQSGLGKGLLGAGRGIADQLTSRSESFSSNQFGSNFTRGSGSRDLGSLGSAALKGLADPILDNPNSSESSLLLNSGQSVRLKVNQSFPVSL